jgi:tRNA (guanine-N7-)-methyltransferase
LSKNKLQRFAETATFPNFIQPALEETMDGYRLKGKWSEEFFHNDHPIYLELGCGKGEYTLALARMHPENNYIGIDIKGARMWRGAKTALEEKLNNVAFLRTQVGMVDKLFDAAEISGLWITFPDPQPQHARENKRLTSQRFLRFYSRVLTPAAVIHLKTDNVPLFDFTLDVIEQNAHKLIYATRDVYNEADIADIVKVKTFYEQIWLAQGLKINYLCFSLNAAHEKEP